MKVIPVLLILILPLGAQEPFSPAPAEGHPALEQDLLLDTELAGLLAHVQLKVTPLEIIPLPAPGEALPLVRYPVLEAMTAPPEVQEQEAYLEAGPWKGSVSLLGTFREGNISSSLFELRISAAKQWDRDRLKLELLGGYGETESETTAQYVLGRGKYDYFLDKDFYIYGLGEAEYDKIKDLDLRILAGAGVGFNAWTGERDHQSLDIEAGLTFIYRDFSTAADSEEDVAARVALDYKNRLGETVLFSEWIEFLLPIPDTGEYVLRSITKVELPLGESWYLNNVLEIEYQGDPAPGADDLDIKLLVGITYTF